MNLRQGQHPINHRAHPRHLHRPEQTDQLRTSTARRSHHPLLQIKHPTEISRRVRTTRRPRDNHTPTRPKRPQRMRPRRLTHRLDHHIHPLRHPLTRHQRDRTPQRSLPPLHLATTCRIHPSPRRHRQRDRRRRHTPTHSLHKNTITRTHTSLSEQHPIRSPPRHRQTRRLIKGQPRRLRHQITTRHTQILRERTIVPLREQRPTRIERLIPSPSIRVPDHRTHDNGIAVLVVPSRVTPQNPRQTLRRMPHPPQRPQIVPVERGRDHPHHRPSRPRLGPISHMNTQTGQGIVRILRHGRGGKHDVALTSWTRWGTTTNTAGPADSSAPDRHTASGQGTRMAGVTGSGAQGTVAIRSALRPALRFRR
jgi:hypothetical protein